MGPCRTCGANDRSASGQCRPCRREAQRRYHQSSKGREKDRLKSARYRVLHPDRVRAAYKPRRLKREFGITYEQYQAMLAEQNGCCVICGRAEQQVTKLGHPKMLAVDHDAITGVVRGLLCGNCNVGLGLFGHEPARLVMAALYLERITTTKKSIDAGDSAKESLLGGGV